MSMIKNWDGKRPDTKIYCGKSMTKQSFADECDINKIVARFEKSDMITHLNEGEPFYGDVSEYGDLKEAIDKVNSANELFMAMDPKVRSKFDNDPVKMVEFLSDESNKAEAIALGMVIPEPVAPVVAPAPPVVP